LTEQLVLESMERGLLTVTINRPERRNALNPGITSGLLDAFARATDDPQVRAVLLRGAGGTFCVGGDVKAMATRDAAADTFEHRVADLRRRVDVSRLIHEMPKPVVCMIDGAAAGAGLSIALACDIRIAGASAKLTTAFAKVGLSGDFGGSYFLTQLVGSGKARELYLTSPVLTAQEALKIGMVNRVVPDGELEKAARELALALADGPTVTLGYIKRNINLAQHNSLSAQLDAECLHHTRCASTEDHKEAAKAFVEKRAALFQGR
jgi:2-(1,2-epoxy-1,2-dihydrophenyl)acetyl-CoA isomerase